jgi:hypothetical protein
MWKLLGEVFKDGDILYGLDRGRNAAKQAILAHRSKVEKKTVYFGLITTRKTFERIIIQNDITNSVFNPAKPGLLSDKEINEKEAVKADPHRAIGFRDFVAQHPKYGLSNYQPSNAKDRQTNEAHMRAAWLKTSKAGLQFQAKHGSGYKIHFILDGLDYSRVLAQDNVKATIAATNMHSPLDITSGEVRWLFRNRNDQEVVKAVVFWLAGQQVRPPWESHRTEFANFLYTKDQILKDDQQGGFREAIRELKAALMLQRAFRKGKGTYYVRPGDSLQLIATVHSVSVDDLKKWNKLKDDLIEFGQLLHVVPPRPTRSLPPVPAQNVTVGSRVAFFENLAAPTTRPRR